MHFNQDALYLSFCTRGCCGCTTPTATVDDDDDAAAEVLRIRGGGDDLDVTNNQGSDDDNTVPYLDAATRSMTINEAVAGDYEESEQGENEGGAAAGRGEDGGGSDNLDNLPDDDDPFRWKSYLSCCDKSRLNAISYLAIVKRAIKSHGKVLQLRDDEMIKLLKDKCFLCGREHIEDVTPLNSIDRIYST